MQEAEVIERVLSLSLVQRLLRVLTKRRAAGKCYLEWVFCCYCQGRVGIRDRFRFGLLLWVLERIRKQFKVPKARMVGILEDVPTVRGLIVTCRSIGQYGLTHPQVFSAPLLVVWNFTQACNLRCRHCYQDASRRLDDELSLASQLRIVEEIAGNDVPLIAFSGGEPLMSESFWPVTARAADLGLHVSLATNGTLLSKEVVARLATVGVNYVEVSLDSVDPRKHDAFRGPRAWRRTVEGIANAAANSHLVVGVATTITRFNVEEVDSLIQFAQNLGTDRFYAFNFVPTGRGEREVELDLSPQMREGILQVLYHHLNVGEMQIMSTAPQYGRVCVAGGSHGVTTPCVFMPIGVGDLRVQSFMEIWQGSPVFASLRQRDDNGGHCGVCRYRYYCGGCRARAYAYFGDFKAPDPGCMYNEGAWRRLGQEKYSRPYAIA